MQLMNGYNFLQGGAICLANFFTFRLIDSTNIAKIICAIAVLFASGPLQSRDLPNRAKPRLTAPALMTAALNELPTAAPDLVGLRQSANAFNVLANDSDADGDRLTMVGAIANFGAVAFTPEGLLAYAQNPGPARADKITYIVSDGRGGFAEGKVEIVVR